MLSANESRRRDKHDTMMTFVILKMLYEAINKEEIRSRAEEFLIMGRVKLIDQVLYEMAKNRRSKKECPTTPPNGEESKPQPTADQDHPPAQQPPATSQQKPAGARPTV